MRDVHTKSVMSNVPEGALALLPVGRVPVLAREGRVVQRVDGGAARLHRDGREGVVADLVVGPPRDLGAALEVARRDGEDARDLGHQLGCGWFEFEFGFVGGWLGWE